VTKATFDPLNISTYNINCRLILKYMSMKAIKIIILNIVFLCTVQLAFSQDYILPIEKPVLSAEIIKKKIKKKFLIPQKKPI